MKIDDRYFEKSVQSKLAEHETDVRSDLWAAIESQLPVNTAIRKVPLYRRVIGYSAAAVTVGIVVAIVLWQTPDHQLPAPIITENDKGVLEIVQPQPATFHTSTASAATSLDSRSVSVAAESETEVMASFTNMPTTATHETEAVVSVADHMSKPGHTARTPQDEKTYRQKLDEFEHAGRNLKAKGKIPDAPEHSQKGAGIQLGMMAANASPGSSQNSARAIRTKIPTMLAAQHNPVYHFDHSMPISAGITVTKTLPQNWALESGLVYTYLYSKYRSNNGNGSQELHYLGIPLNAIYRFARIKRFSFYAAAGGQVDFYLAGRQKDEGYDEGISGSGYKELKHENVQFSIQANLGAAFTLYKQTELYLEPYMAYYIENNSSIHNVWKDKPFNFGLTLGIRTGF